MSQVDKQLDTLKSEIEQEIPNDITVTDVKYEGPGWSCTPATPRSSPATAI